MFDLYAQKYVHNLKTDSNVTPEDIKRMTEDQHAYRYSEFYTHISKPFRINTKYVEAKWEYVYPLIFNSLQE